MKFDMFLKGVEHQIDLLSGELTKQLKGIQVAAPPKRIRQAFKEMQPEDWAEEIKEKGYAETIRHIKDMKRREAISNANIRRP